MAKKGKSPKSSAGGKISTKLVVVVVALVIIIAVVLLLNRGLLTGLLYGGGDNIKLVNMTFTTETIRVYAPGLNENVTALKISLDQQPSQEPPYLAMKFYPDAQLDTPSAVYVVLKSLSTSHSLAPGSIVYYRKSTYGWYVWYVDSYGGYVLDPVTKKYSIKPVSIDLYRRASAETPYTPLVFTFGNTANLAPTSVVATLKEETGTVNVINGQWQVRWNIVGPDATLDRVFYGGGLRGGTSVQREPTFSSFGESTLFRADRGTVVIQYAYNQGTGYGRFVTS